MLILGVTGCIAAYKAPEFVRLLVQAGHEVHVVMTAAAAQFVTPLSLQTVSGHPVHQELFRLTETDEISHTHLADHARLVVVAPATAACLARVAHGLCEDLLTTLICATKARVVFAPAMNTGMWENRVTQENVRRLHDLGYGIIPPAHGELACGHVGLGRLPEPAALVQALAPWLSAQM